MRWRPSYKPWTEQKDAWIGWEKMEEVDATDATVCSKHDMSVSKDTARLLNE